jgi:Mg-chelatase subunit ChlD
MRRPFVFVILSVALAATGLAVVVAIPASAPAAQAQSDRRVSRTTVTLTSTTDCPAQRIPLNIVLSIDGSLSMNPNNKLVNAKRAASQFVNKLDFDVTKVGVTAFGGRARLKVKVTDNQRQVQSAINSIITDWGTDMEGGIALSHQILTDAQSENPDPDLPPPNEVIVLLSDGRPWPAGNNPMRTAARAKGSGILLITVCVGGDCDSALMRNLASRPDLFFDVQQSSRLVGIYEDIANELLETDLRRLTIVDELPANMEYVDGSANIEPDSFKDNKLQWNMSTISKSGITLTYKVEPLEAGIWPTNVEATGKFWDTEDRIGEFTFPIPEVEVRVPPTPTPTLTPSITPTPVPTDTPTPTLTPIPTDTPTPTPTPIPRPVYLPLALKERPCIPKIESTDVALVIDVSSSMDGPTRQGGVTKRVAAARAARLFLERLDLPRDQMAVIVFSDRAELLADLGGNRAGLGRTLDRLPSLTGTRIGAGLRMARRVLTGPRHRPENTSAVLLITDGRPTRSDEADVVTAGRELHEAGITVFAVGLGADVNPELLARIASDPNKFYETPHAEELVDALRAIYRQIAYIVPCDPDQYWGRRH